MNDGQNNNPPEITGEQPGDPTILGSLKQDEIARINYLRQQATGYTIRLGQLDRQRWELNQQIDQFEEAANSVLKEVGRRLGVPTGTLFQVDDDGTVRSLPSQQVPPTGGQES